MLEELFPPLRLISGAGFERVGNLQGLGRLVEHAGKRAVAGGLEAARLEPLLGAARDFDGAQGGERVAAAKRVILALGELVPLPAQLAQVARSAAEEGAKPPPAGSQPEVRRGATEGVKPPPAGHQPEVRRGAMGGAKPPPAGQQLGSRGGAAKGVGRRGGQQELRIEQGAAALARQGAGPKKKPRAAPPSEVAEGEETRSKVGVPAFARELLNGGLEGYRGVGPKVSAALAKKGIHTEGEVLYSLPRGYQDRRRLLSIRELVPGQKGLALVEVVGSKEINVARSRRRMLRVTVADPTGQMALTFFHFWAATSKRLLRGKRFFVWGDVKLFGGVKQIVHPELEEAEERGGESNGGLASLSAGRVVPVYRGMDELGQGRYRSLVQQALEHRVDSLPELLPDALVRERRLISEGEALRSLHFPDDRADVAALLAGASPGHRRLAYVELLLLSLGLALKARGIQVEPGHRFDTSAPRVEEALSYLPFQPTGAQRRAIEAIAADMAGASPMNRLLQGDVGSGKTAVALVACLLAVLDGRQAALMAPTELLAEQHHRSFSKLLEGSGIELALLATGRGSRALAEGRERMASGKARIAIGTHALVSQGSVFQELGLVVIDEQHRFGVEQRAELIGKGLRPDVLVMTATPIPRTLSLVLHGELTQTVIDELPPGRTPVQTKVVTIKGREKIYRQLEKQLGEGRQAYVVYPLIEESEHSDLEDATRGLASLRERFPGRRLELLHGRMKPEERDQVMEAFRSGAIDLLVSTTVVEVGVDVPNASAMVIEHAERFGLSQLHQLRGRVGRGAAKSLCFLVDHGSEGRARERLAVMEQTTDGFRIAAADLEIRGPGEFLGTKQAGLPELEFADLSRDARLLEQARADAFALVARDPTLSLPEHRLLKKEVFERFATRMSLAQVG